MQRFIPKRKVSFFLLLIVLPPLHSFYIKAALINRSRTEGREAFEELTSWGIFKRPPIDLVSFPHKHLLVAGMARNQAGCYVSHDVVALTVDYVAPDNGYSTEQLEKLKKGGKMIESDLLGDLHIAKDLMPLALQDKVKIKRFGRMGQPKKMACYCSNDLLASLLLGEKKKNIFQLCGSLLCTCFCHCCKGAPDLRLRTYEEAIAEGWGDAHIVRLKNAIVHHTYYNRGYYFHNKELYQAIGFYMDPAYHSEEKESLSILPPTD